MNIKARGCLRTILWLKDLRTVFYAYLGGRILHQPFVGITNDGIPRVFGPLIPLIRKSDRGAIRLCLTLLLISRILPGWKPVDTSTIESPFRGDPSIFSDIRVKSFRIFSNLGIGKVPLPQWDSPHVTTKMGPNGRAIYSYKADLLMQPDSLLKAIGVIGGDALRLYMEHLLNNPNILNEDKYQIDPKGSIRKLSVVKDVDGKSRVIAMADYWSQTALLPQHRTVMSQLRNIGPDVTFGQNIAPFGSPLHDYHSFDLTAATDRIPVEIYRILLMRLFGRDYAKAWETIMCSLPFDFQSRKIHYATGQPMGMYSSWALMALGHHMIVQYSAQIAGYSNFTDYRLLGDDIVIRHNQVARVYLETMNRLGVEISAHKTLVSRDTFEFAKRFFHLGVEVTGFPINGLQTAQISGSWVDILTVALESSRRDFCNWQLDPVRTQRLLMLCPRLGWNLSKRVYRKVITQYLVQTDFKGMDTQTVARLWALPVSCVTSIESFKQEFYSNLITAAGTETVKVCDRVEDLLREEEPSQLPSPEMDPFSGMDNWLMGGVVRDGELRAPISWILRDSWSTMQALISRFMQVQLSGIRNSSSESMYEALFVDLDPQVFTLASLDQRRKVARQFGFMSSLTIKAFAKMSELR